MEEHSLFTKIMTFLVLLQKVARWIWDHPTLALFVSSGLIVAVIFVYVVSTNHLKQKDLENQLNVEKQAQSEKDSRRIETQKEAVNQAANEVNQAKNANFSNLSDEELRRRIIEAANKIK